MADEIDELISGRAVSPATRLTHFGIALLAIIPAAMLFVQIFVVDVGRSRLTIGAAIVATAVVLGMAYQNLSIAHVERLRSASSPPTKSAFKGKKSEFEAAMSSYERKVDQAAFAYSVCYNNAIFLLTAPFVGCYIFSDKFSGDLNFLVSSSAAAGLALFNSKSALKAIAS